MSKADTTLAKKIVDQHGNAEKNKGSETWVVSVPLIGFRHDAYKTKTESRPDSDAEGKTIKGGHTEKVEVAVKITKAEALDVAAGVLADQFADGSIVLSDDWADTNLS